ncbi:SDR family oxidoreductase [Bacillus dakarensis]|uniref:SDR family oxidoreductase n=1 Tax=Robertmurraya dakarensis TaxID=1926278 RepID=UPI000981D751|nr:SDR family oxidoreductase [Bacillus dakarensis]
MQIVLVTGANGGFGRLTCIELIESGFHVIATMRNIENGKDLAAQVEHLGLSERLTVLQMDVTKIAEIEKAKGIVEEKFGKLDILINNAGYCQGGFIEDLTLEEWETQLGTNVTGTFSVIKTFLPILESAGHAHIINISSVSGYFGFPGMSPYCSSKFALEGMSESLRLELLPRNIHVSLVEPASYQTKIWEKGLENIKIEETDSSYKKQVYKYAKNAEEHGSDPVEVAKLVVKICKMDRPRFRYPIGKGAKSLSILKRIMPWGVIEFVVMKKLT